MSENHKEGLNDKPTADNQMKDALMNLADNLMKDEMTIDMNSIMRMATNLLTNDSLMNSVKDLGNFAQLPVPDFPEYPETLETEQATDLDLAPLTEQLEKLTAEMAEVKKELADIKEQNKHFIESIQTLGMILKRGWY